MCTVSYIPLSNNNYILTSNRDESYDRTEVIFPSIKPIDQKIIVFPKDKKAGGTWIACDNNGLSICLLNGALEYHKHMPPYKKSRGLVLLEAFNFKNPIDFIENYNFIDIEPFTLIFCNSKNNLELIEFFWNGNEKKYNKIDDTKPKIWSSAKLYSQEIVIIKNKRFDKFTKQTQDFDTEKIRNFHKGSNNKNTDDSYLIDLGFVGTISITNIEKKDNSFNIVYEDLISEAIKKDNIDIV